MLSAFDQISAESLLQHSDRALALTSGTSAQRNSSATAICSRFLPPVRIIFLRASDMSKIIFLTEIIYIPTIAVLKISFLLFFERVFFPNQTLKYLTRCGMTIISLVYTGIFFKSLYQCRPIQKSFQPLLPGKCDTFYVMPYLSGVFNMISDFYILLLPLPFIWSLKMNLRRKIRVMAVFSVGLL